MMVSCIFCAETDVVPSASFVLLSLGLLVVFTSVGLVNNKKIDLKTANAETTLNLTLIQC